MLNTGTDIFTQTINIGSQYNNGIITINSKNNIYIKKITFLSLNR